MKNKIVLYALRLLPYKKQQALFVRALNYLVDVQDLKNFNNKTTQIQLRGEKVTWRFSFDGEEIVTSQLEPEIQIKIDPNDLLNFPTMTQLKQKIESGDIELIAKDADKIAFLSLFESISPIKINQCIRYLRRMLGLRETRIEDKKLSSLTIRDIGSEGDVNYVRDQALLHETTDRALSFNLMLLAHGARPKGPFIKRKLEEYRLKGFDKQVKTSDKPLQVIEVVRGKLAYFPVPKVGCSSIKTALYQYHQQREFRPENYDGKHVHDYWQQRTLPIDSYEKTVIVVRDPIERFLSAYASRVLDHGETNRNAVEKQSAWLLNTLPHFKPNLTQFIEHLDVYLQVPSILHHCQPLSELVNHDLSQFSHVVTIRDMASLQTLFSETVGKDIVIPHQHVGKNKVSLGELSRPQIDKLLQFYDQDYELLAPWYSKQAILQKWQNTRRDLMVITDEA